MEDELIQEFITESREHLATIETDLLTIEDVGENANSELLNKVFRAAHSIKGAAGFFDLRQVKELAHKAETVLDLLRSRQIVPKIETTTILLRAFDRLRDLVNDPGKSNTADITAEVRALENLASTSGQPSESACNQSVSMTTVGADKASAIIAERDWERVRREGQNIFSISLDLLHDLDRGDKQILTLFRDLVQYGEILDCKIEFEKVGSLEESFLNVIPVELLYASSKSPIEICELVKLPGNKLLHVSALTCDTGGTPPTLPTPTAARHEVSTSASSKGNECSVSSPNAVVAPDETLRINVGVLDELMNLAGELVLSRNQYESAVAQKNFRMLASAGKRLNQVTSEMQDAIMRTRLQPIDNLLSRLPRVVRDLANSLAKEVKLEVVGRDVALDRSLLEGLADPLTHMIRNAVDHGIEMPDARLQAGKPRSGTLRVEARHEAGQVVIDIQDDGDGIDYEKVSKAALAKGLVTHEQLKSMSTDEQAALIMMPGLSTAEKVTQVSGRGVGMDVVKTNISRLGGQIQIASKRHKGTLFTIKLPLTLTIIPALILAVSDERFAIPQTNVQELLRVRGGEANKFIETIGDREVLVLREQILPLLRLGDFLAQKNGGEPARANESLVNQRNSTNEIGVAVLTTGSFSYGLVVDAFENSEEIVVKPLGRHLKEAREYSGATILGDGTVALIIDVSGLAAKAELTVSSSRTPVGHGTKSDAESQISSDVHSFLVFNNSPREACAIPLEVVRRIEKIGAAEIETVGGRRTMKYRDKSLPLISLSDSACVGDLDDRAGLAVIVFTLYGREVGLLASMPLEVKETDSAIDGDTHRQSGIAGSAIIEGATTLLVDYAGLVDLAYPEWKSACSPVDPTCTMSTVLLAEDSDFFRAQVKRFLEADGHAVIEARDGEDAWELLLKHRDEVQVLVTDIEMPRVSGLELAARVRADNRTRALPIIAVSSLAADDDVERARIAGVDKYEIKLDRDSLLSQVRNALAFSHLSESAVRPM